MSYGQRRLGCSFLYIVSIYLSDLWRFVLPRVQCVNELSLTLSTNYYISRFVFHFSFVVSMGSGLIISVKKTNVDGWSLKIVRIGWFTSVHSSPDLTNLVAAVDWADPGRYWNRGRVWPKPNVGWISSIEERLVCLKSLSITLKIREKCQGTGIDYLTAVLRFTCFRLMALILVVNMC